MLIRAEFSPDFGLIPTVIHNSPLPLLTMPPFLIRCNVDNSNKKAPLSGLIDDILIPYFIPLEGDDGLEVLQLALREPQLVPGYVDNPLARRTYMRKV